MRSTMTMSFFLVFIVCVYAYEVRFVGRWREGERGGETYIHYLLAA